MTTPESLSTRAVADRRNGRDGGFILATLGLLLIPIVAFTALAVDVSSWYSRATELQRAADSAALAGVIWMPNLGQAEAQGTTVLAKNNVVNGSGGLTVTMGVGSEDNSFKVCVTDGSAPQYFSSVFTGPESLTRCGTAKYNLPLQIGSPQNFVGGNATDYPMNPGQPEVQAQPASDNPYPPGSPPNYNDRPTNYNTATASDGQKHGCKAVTGTVNGHPVGYWWNTSGSRTTRDGTYSQYLDNSVVWTTSRGTVRHYATELPDCIWHVDAIAYQPYIPPSYPIRPSMNPGFWASVEAPGTDAVQGDEFSGQCYGQGAVYASSCAGNYPNPNYNSQGYYYTLRINAANPKVLLQVFDAAFDLRSSSTSETGDIKWSTGATWQTNFQLLAPDNTPFDPTDNPVVSSGSCGTLGSQATNPDNAGSWSITNNDNTGSATEFKNTWRTLCTLTAPPVTTNNSTYFLRVWSSGGQGNASNAYALRAIAANSSTNLDLDNYPLDALSLANQPTLAVWQHMSIFTNIQGGKATFFLAKVTQDYTGKTLVMDLYDPGEGASSVTINNPTGTQQGCTYSSARLRNISGGNGSDGGTIASPVASTTVTGTCTITTGNSRFNGNVLTVKMPIPSTGYTCDPSVRPATVNDTTFTGNGCWWSITYQTSSSDVHDNTTWGAQIEGDPVRLIQ